MMKFQSYFNTAVILIKQYNGELPLVYYLKKYFSENKKHGSKDRKIITHFCYCYYRLGFSLRELIEEERLKIAIFLCTEKHADFNILFDDFWLENWENDLFYRIKFIQSLHPDFFQNAIFPFQNEISESINSIEFAQSFLVQPKLFLRIRPGQKEEVIDKLQKSKIDFKILNNDCIVLPNTTKINNILEVNKQVVIQDFSSQQIAKFFPSKINDQLLSIWDCCAGSGGKSILAFDFFKNIELTVSDIRTTIIQNLHKRFIEAGIENYKSFITDLTNENKLPVSNFNLIIYDAPCTGSGTWSRTPEQLYFFKIERINHYVKLQQKIVNNAIQHLNKEGYFLYITCSVFKKENEEMVLYIQQKCNLQLLKQELLEGFKMKADTMFVALFTNRNAINL